ncbi:ABZJ_00895 family protein [Acinetobacter terrestris]|uniref:ABZJ_00895 family protein n=1 Tax=Acinetobacter terrestris TaxID=2529843 RepID=A0AAW6UN12_9GAMM|nr:ABZJ_00895 family protein [Acinetobacter terrestris]MDK1682778.1 ABZJ_00895 family protein [Acinetobacter terrestris]
MSHYLKYFAAVYSIALILLVSILIYGLKLGAITLLLPSLIASAFLSARHFVKREQRLPNKKEKNTLVWGSTIIAMSMGFIVIFLLIFLHPRAEGILITIGYAGRAGNSFLVAIAIALHGLIFHIAYNGYARYSLNKLK